jgi:hypothetical protein
MAVQERELIQPTERPRLHLVEPPARRGRPAAAVVLVVMLAGLLGLPAGRALLRGTPPIPRWQPRPLPAAQVGELPPLPPAPRSARPRSNFPFAGLAFVRCTRLWTARPDGNHQRRILRMTGIASPTFSSDARTIAFLKDGRELWLVGARGENPTKVGTIGAGDLPAEAYVTSLMWSPSSDRLALAVVTPTYDQTIDGSAIYRLDIATGDFERVGVGSPPIAWQGWRLFYGQRDGTDVDVRNAGRPHNSLRNLSTEAVDLSAVTTQPSWSGVWRRGAAILRRSPSGRLEVLVRRTTWSRSVHLRAPAPRGYDINERGGLAMSQDASRVFVELIDSRGEANVGVLDTRSGSWQMLDHAWDPVTSPAPVARRLLSARAVSASEDLLGSWRGRMRRFRLLTGGPVERRRLPFRLYGFTVGRPTRSGNGWRLPATVFGRGKEGIVYRTLSISATAPGERLRLDPQVSSPAIPVATFADAMGFVRAALGRDVPAPTWLPPNARLQRYPLSAWSWDRSLYASIGLRLGPGKSMIVSYGDVGFNLGCGATNEPRDEDVAGAPGVFDHVSGAKQVIWPATVKRQRTAFFSVYGDVPKETIMRVAESIEAAR